ncbi:hypothetical protein KSP40_PGU004818 [Platanthera guangdongensis]|uniref:Uncharacterized protein n=1 Tax=Platanthera guangdongensis TaxID=2320717 RepID=A0ABR2M1E5_9ASPA
MCAAVFPWALRPLAPAKFSARRLTAAPSLSLCPRLQHGGCWKSSTVHRRSKSPTAAMWTENGVLLQDVFSAALTSGIAVSLLFFWGEMAKKQIFEQDFGRSPNLISFLIPTDTGRFTRLPTTSSLPVAATKHSVLGIPHETLVQLQPPKLTSSFTSYSLILRRTMKVDTAVPTPSLAPSANSIVVFSCIRVRSLQSAFCSAPFQQLVPPPPGLTNFSS